MEGVGALPFVRATAFEELFAMEYSRVVAVAYRVLGDRADAEDVAQDVFARILLSARMPAPGTLSLSAAHRAINLLRSRRRRIARELADETLNRPLRTAIATSADPLAILDGKQRQALIRAVMLRLSRRDAEILALRYGGASYREVAHILSIDTAQIGVRLARAERAFKREVERAGLI